MGFSRAGLIGSCFFVAFVLVLAPTSALAYNSNNHGHHYGQLKHRLAAPPKQPPVSGVSVAVARLPGGGGAGQDQSVSQPVSAGQPVTVSPIRLRFLAPPPQSPNAWWWLILLVVPLLAGVWLLVFVRGALALARRRELANAAA